MDGDDLGQGAKGAVRRLGEAHVGGAETPTQRRRGKSEAEREETEEERIVLEGDVSSERGVDG